MLASSIQTWTSVVTTGSTMAGRPPDPRTSWRAVTASAAVVVLALAGCGGGGDVAEPQPDTAARSETPTPTPTPTTTQPVDLATFPPIDRATLDAVVADPDAAAGQQMILFAVVQRFYSATGPGTFQARLTTVQPADRAEGTGAVVRVAPELLTDVEIGDVVKLHAQVTGTFGGASGATSRTPELSAFAVEEVGLRDLAADVVLGAPASGGGVTVPVTVTNSGDVPMDYRVEVMAASADGAQNYGTMTARVPFLAPGQAGVASVRFTGAVPDGAQFTVASVGRTASPPQ